MTKEILSLFDDVPGLNVLCIGKDVEDLAGSLQKELVKKQSKVTAKSVEKKISLDFTLPNREFEGAVLYNVDFRDENFITLLLKIYDSLETTATVIFINETQNELLYDLMPLLEEGRLQNANSIDLVQGYNIVVAKKLQMWV